MMSVPRLPDTHTGPVTAYLGVFRRPQNTAAIVESLLRVRSVGGIIVSENQPGVMRGWKTDFGPRVRIIRHSTRQTCIDRYRHLQAAGCGMFLITDDDLFLLPRQIETVLTGLSSKPSVPHGVCGQIFDGSVLRSNVRSGGEADVLNRLYAFTADHLKEFFRIAEKTGALRGTGIWQHAPDDLILSRCVSGRPVIHDTGPFVDCTSQGKEGTALWREPGFMENRMECLKIIGSA